MQSISINTAKIDKSALYQGKSGKYLNIVLRENKDGPDQYGNDGFVVQDIPRDRRDAGEKGPIIGNWKHIGGDRRGGQQSPAPAHTAAHSSNQPAQDEEDDVPF